jgi:hypothetical protein
LEQLSIRSLLFDVDRQTIIEIIDEVNKMDGIVQALLKIAQKPTFSATHWQTMPISGSSVSISLEKKVA